MVFLKCNYGFSKMAVAIFSPYFCLNPSKGKLNGSLLYPSTTKMPVAWNFYPLFTTPTFSLKYVLYWKKTTSKMFGAIAFFSYFFEPKYFMGAITRLWRFVWTKKNQSRTTFNSKIFQECLKCAIAWMDVARCGQNHKKLPEYTRSCRISIPNKFLVKFYPILHEKEYFT